jgi:hypothetical protein
MSMHFKLLIVGTVVFLLLLWAFSSNYEHETTSEGMITGMSDNTMWTTRLTALYLCFVSVLFGHAVFGRKAKQE